MRELSHIRKAEIGGILIMGIAILHLLSIVTYDSDDYGIALFIPTSDIFSLEPGVSMKVHNWLGIVGVFVSYMFVDELFGYMSVGISLMLFILGWHVFRGSNLIRLIWHAAYILWMMILLRRDVQRAANALKNSLMRRLEHRLQKKKTRRIRSEEQAGKPGGAGAVFGSGDKEKEENALDRKNKDKTYEVPGFKYKYPTIDLLDSPPPEGNKVDLEEIEENKRIIFDKLRRHKIEILNINAIVGPSVTLCELEPAPDVKINKIQSYATDLKMATAAHGLRLIAPVPGRSAVGIEIPNKTRETVYIRSLINTRKFLATGYELPVALGKTIENEVFIIDLTRMPHLPVEGDESGSVPDPLDYIDEYFEVAAKLVVLYQQASASLLQRRYYRSLQGHFAQRCDGGK